MQSFARSYWLGTFLFLYFAIGVSTITSGHVWGDDWAQYVLHARNIVTGHPYADTGYVFNPDIPNAGPPSYPPGLPLLLAPIVAVFGTDIVPLKIACVLFLALALPPLAVILTREYGRTIAIPSLLLFALYETVWELRDQISSESAYIMLTMSTMWYSLRDGSVGRLGFASIAAGAWLGALAFAAVACRSIGVSLAVAMLVYGWAHRKPIGWFTGFAASFAVLVWLQRIFLVMPTTYSNELRAPTSEMLLGNAIGYWRALRDIFRVPFGLSQVAATLVVALMLVGIGIVLTRRGPAEEEHPGLRDYAARVPLSLWYLAAYFCALLFVAIAPISRYLLPVLPFIIALAATGTFLLLRHLPRPRFVYGLTAVVFALYYVALHVSAVRPTAADLATCTDCRELYSFIHDHTAPGTVIAFAKPRAMALLGGRPSWTWSPRYSAAEFERKARAAGVGVLVVGAAGSAWAERNPPMAHAGPAAKSPPGPILFRNATFIAFNVAG